MSIDPTTVTKLEETLAAIKGYADPRRAADEWKQAFRLLQKAGVPTPRITGVVGMRDAAKLAELVAQLRGPAGVPQPEVPDEETCRLALKAFRKRSALVRLDEESKLGRGPLSKGDVPTAAAIVPPDEWPEAVWQELVRQGALRYIGHGLYELA